MPDAEVTRCCLLCGRWGNRAFRPADAGREGWVCLNDRACATRVTSPGEPDGGCVPCRTCGGSQSQGWHLHDRVTSPAECDRGPCYLGYDHDGPCKPGRVLPPAKTEESA